MDRLSVKWKLFGWLALFSALLLVLLWLFQIVFLESFYKSIKTEALKSSGEMIVKNIENENLDELIDQLVLQKDVSVRITDSMGNTLLQNSLDPRDRFGVLSQWENAVFYQRTAANGGVLFETFSQESFDFSRPGIPPDGTFGGRTQFKMETMIYARLVSLNDGTPVMVMLHSTITPINSTVETLQVQFV